MSRITMMFSPFEPAGLRNNSISQRQLYADLIGEDLSSTLTGYRTHRDGRFSLTMYPIAMFRRKMRQSSNVCPIAIGTLNSLLQETTLAFGSARVGNVVKEIGQGAHLFGGQHDLGGSCTVDRV